MKVGSGCGWLVVLLLCTACVYEPHMRNQYETACTLPDVRLAEAWEQLVEARSAPGGCDLDAQGQDRCQGVRSEIERIAFACPNHTPSMMTMAVLDYEAGSRFKAQQRLDSLLELVKVHPEAAALRGRIAMEEGNLPFALTFLKQHINLSPDHAPLREVYAAALFLSGKVEEADGQLAVAQRLGAPRWRVAYHLGLFAERKGKIAEARRLYREAADLRPGWDVPLIRLNGLLAMPVKGESSAADDGSYFELPSAPEKGKE